MSPFLRLRQAEIEDPGPAEALRSSRVSAVLVGAVLACALTPAAAQTVN